MTLLTAFLTYLGKYILLICVAVAGFILPVICFYGNMWIDHKKFYHKNLKIQEAKK